MNILCCVSPYFKKIQLKIQFTEIKNEMFTFLNKPFQFISSLKYYF